MPPNKTFRVSLPPRLREFLESQVTSGQFQTAEEVMCEGLRLMEARASVSGAAMRNVRRKIATGLNQARRGELSDGHAFFDKLARKLKDRASRGARR